MASCLGGIFEGKKDMRSEAEITEVFVHRRRAAAARADGGPATPKMPMTMRCSAVPPPPVSQLRLTQISQPTTKRPAACEPEETIDEVGNAGVIHALDAAMEGSPSKRPKYSLCQGSPSK